MTTQGKNKAPVIFILSITMALFICFISACGKGGNASPVGLNTQIEVVNLSPDALPVALYQNFLNYTGSTYTYPNNSGYFFLSTLTPPLQIKTSTNNPDILFEIDSTLKPNSKYTLFITGYKKDSSILKSFLINDATALPPLGKGKVRFFNGSPSSPNLDMRINDTLTKEFTNRAFNSVSSYIDVPAGNYKFDISANRTSTKIETSIPTVTIQDGQAYTIFSHGIVGRADSVAFGATVIVNNLLVKATQ